MTADAKEEKDFCLFVGRDIDDYGLALYEFRLYARISRRSGSGEAWESLTNIASSHRIIKTDQVLVAKRRRALLI